MTFDDKDPGEGSVSHYATTYDIKMSWIVRLWRRLRNK
jgi:hypothetical protein